MENHATSAKEAFEAMSTQQLDEILNRELHTVPPDMDAIRLILHILWQREKDIPVVLTPQMQEAWEKYQKKMERISAHAKQTAAMHSLFKRMLSAAAALVLVFLLMVPQKAQAGSIWGWLVRVTEDVVEFFTPADNEARLMEYTFQTENPGLQQVYDTAVENGIDFPVVPMWLPGEYELVECRVLELDSKKRILATLTDDSHSFVININIYNQNEAHSFEKDESQIKIKEIEGTQFTIISNNNSWAAVWGEENIECSIFVGCQEEELYKILRSIYLMEE